MDPELRQSVLDELTGRLEAERLGAEPVWDALRYLHRLCLRAREGEFHPNLGLSRRREQPRAPSAPSPSQSSPSSANPEGAAERRQQWRKRFAALGEQLGVYPEKE